jgi:hypothetical protein
VRDLSIMNKEIPKEKKYSWYVYYLPFVIFILSFTEFFLSAANRILLPIVVLYGSSSILIINGLLTICAGLLISWSNNWRADNVFWLYVILWVFLVVISSFIGYDVSIG